MAKFIKSKFRVLWGTIFSFFAGIFTSDISSQEVENNVNDENASEEAVNKYNLKPMAKMVDFHFHGLDLIDIQIRKAMKLLTPDGVLCMKVNPNCPNFDGSILPWYNKWTKSLAYHYGEVYNKKVTNMRESTRGRFKWEYE